MPLTHINNLESGIAVRAQLNATVDQVNTNVTNIATNTSSIATINSTLTTKQDTKSLSTLVNGFRVATTNITLLNTDTNYVILVTNTGATTFTCPPTGSIALFQTGAPFYVVNNGSSTNNITLTPGAAVTINGVVTITPGTSALMIMTGTNTYLRIF